jgi:hypothetical protein
MFDVNILILYSLVWIKWKFLQTLDTYLMFFKKLSSKKILGLTPYPFTHNSSNSSTVSRIPPVSKALIR